MATSLYDLSVASYLQTVGAVAGFLDRAAKQCAETGSDPGDFVNSVPTVFTVDATSVYWTNTDGTVLKLPK